MKKKKRKLNIRKVITFLLLLLALVGLFLYLYYVPIKRVEIKGNNYLKSSYILNELDIKDESLLKLKKKDIKDRLLNIDLISDVSVKKHLNGVVTVEVTEESPLFYNWNNNKIILSNGKEIDYKKEYLGIPSLINTVPDKVYKDFVNKLKRVDRSIISLVSEIEYSPSKVNDKIVDETRFLFRMNDGNIVYINTINIEKINNYSEIYEAVAQKEEDVKGCLYLDSNSENKHFGKCDGDKKVEEEKKNEN